jgi:hypothetical protein
MSYRKPQGEADFTGVDNQITGTYDPPLVFEMEL